MINSNIVIFNHVHLLFGLPSPFIRCGRIWVELDSFVTIMYGSLQFLHPDICTEK